MQYELKCQAFFYVKYIPSYPYENWQNLCRKEFTVHWSAPNSLIRSYLQPCTNSMWGDESEAVAPIIWLYQIVDAQKEEVFFPELLITLRSYGSINSFHNRLMLHHWVISQEVIKTETRSTFQFLAICSAEFKFSFVFWPICWENTLSFFGQKSINTAVVTEKQLKPLIEI